MTFFKHDEKEQTADYLSIILRKQKLQIAKAKYAHSIFTAKHKTIFSFFFTQIYQNY